MVIDTKNRASGYQGLEIDMGKLFEILDGFISNVGDMIADRAEIEIRLRDLDEVSNYAEAAREKISTADAARISEAGLKWVADVNNKNGEWSRMRDNAAEALSDE